MRSWERARAVLTVTGYPVAVLLLHRWAGDAVFGLAIAVVVALASLGGLAAGGIAAAAVTVFNVLFEASVEDGSLIEAFARSGGFALFGSHLLVAAVVGSLRDRLGAEQIGRAHV